jgi:hypothetical protein
MRGMNSMIRLIEVNFEWYEPSMGEPGYFKASQLAAYLMMLARDGYLYEVDSFDASIVLADADIELPHAVGEQYYQFLRSADHDDVELYTYAGIQYEFERVRDTVE